MPCRAILPALAFTCLAVACSGGAVKPQATGTRAVQQAGGRLAIGGVAPGAAGSRVTVKAVEYPVATPATGRQLAAGESYYGALVELCAGTAPTTASSAGWILRLSDSTAAPNANGAKDPAFVAGPLAPGACAAGWIAFSVGAGQTPATLQYTGGAVPATWQALP